MVAKGDTIYAGCQDGYVKVVDLETKTLIRTIIVEEVRPLLHPSTEELKGVYPGRRCDLHFLAQLRSLHLHSEWLD